jgi:hypothetical protein
LKLFFHKLFHWEYWPFQIIYIPIALLWIFYALKQKTLFFFNASNPSMKNGGFFMVSKKEIYDLIPQKYYPKTILIKAGATLNNINQIQYPCIAKPDMGLRGLSVKKIDHFEHLDAYAKTANFDFLIQDLILFENEVGIFYIRFPHEREGKITGIVAKEFLTVTGDGKSSIEGLLKQNPRFELQLNTLKKEFGDGLKQILPLGEKQKLVPYGNHARGAKFIDISHKISVKLTRTINELCLQIPDFYYGRLDIMYDSFEDLEEGKNFQVVELNGAMSEPTHIYDPKHSLLFAWKTLAKHISAMYKISVANHKKGFLYLSHKQGMKQYKLHLAQHQKIIGA